eukprot:NODE_11189_length_287_cov_35.081897.p2 GENE.NODE_11189_length_287_cov_35.081897~~NODE_11189_length_287_cov_35.081897.p2  ORF type:complete len:55 (+),score=3.83 NODE_11189_length_287_cov_35.081897:3-167(+)
MGVIKRKAKNALIRFLLKAANDAKRKAEAKKASSEEAARSIFQEKQWQELEEYE